VARADDAIITTRTPGASHARSSSTIQSAHAVPESLNFQSAVAVPPRKSRPVTGTDHTHYIVICRHRDGLFTPERMFSDVRSKAETIRDIASGQFMHVVDRVIAFNPVEGWSQDVSAEFALAIVDQAEYPQEIKGDLRAFVEAQCGFNTVIPARG